MRLHRLTVRAFGPFATTQEIDFDELCDAGLFLLTGPTGAGKTTILDAVCFALYGSVPGVRGVKGLRSQHAGEDVGPEVVLDFSVRDRRFVVRRTPEWTRPKRRGTGVVAEKASATLLETTRAGEHLLSSRAQEVGHFVSELVGMQSTQFVQVAMLPQGEFQRFLRASTQDRHDLLQHLFRTHRFTRIEEWVHDHGRGLREQAAASQTIVQRLVHTLADRADAALPEDLADEDWTAEQMPERAVTWARALVTSAEGARTTADHARAGAAAEAEAARRVHADAVARQDAWARRAEAERTLADLAATEASATRLHRRLDADERARRCLPLLAVLSRAETEMLDAERVQGSTLRSLETMQPASAVVPEDLTAAGLEAEERRVRDRISRIESLLPRESALLRARSALAEDETSLATARRRHADALGRREALPDEIAQVAERLGAVTDVAASLPARKAELAQATERRDAAQAGEAAGAELVGLREQQRDARDLAADAREHLQAVVARRLAGFAAELARGLVEGDPCQVCGSSDHPAPAQPGPDAVTPEEQESAAVDHDAAREKFHEACRAVDAAEDRRALLVRAAGGRTPAQARAEAAGAAEAVAEASAAEATRCSLETERERLRSELATLAELVHARHTDVTVLTQQVDAHRRTIASAEADLAALEPEVTSPGPATSWSETLRRLQGLLTRLVAARNALARSEDAAARRTDAERQAMATAHDQGFADLDAVRAAVLPEPERARTTRTLDERRAASARAEAVLSDAAVVKATSSPPVDVARCATALGEAEEALGEATRVTHDHTGRVASLRGSLERLERAVEQWVPARDRWLRAESMSRLVRGIGGDNQLQMRLSAYVLATRLDQVIAAANERLTLMRDQRYLLQRTGHAARKGSQAGLGLEVVDQWTGDVRDPATLSGGETFVVSLSLALGLSDVVTQEAGGAEIQTLFVDEGFGTLDADMLDDVMDRLDDLRAGGRAVGVVSHVAELRNRIPTQLHVDKTRTGSTVSVRTLVG